MKFYVKDNLKISYIETNLTEEEHIKLGFKIVEERTPDEIKKRLDELNKDFIQYYLGAVIPNYQEKKAEFISLHNELRELEGKKTRIYKE